MNNKFRFSGYVYLGMNIKYVIFCLNIFLENIFFLFLIINLELYVDVMMYLFSKF